MEDEELKYFRNYDTFISYTSVGDDFSLLIFSGVVNDIFLMQLFNPRNI